MKKLISIFLLVLVLLSFPSITAFAVNNGPSTYHETWGDTVYYQAYLRAYAPDSKGVYFTEGSMYSIFTQNTVQKSGLSKVSYDLATNTLTLNNTAGTPEGKLDIVANMMGDDFKIKVIGNCEAAAITLWGCGYGANLTIIGSGTLTVNKNKDFDYGIFVYSEGTKPLITFGEAVKVNLYGKIAASAILGTDNEDITKTYVFKNGQNTNVIQSPYTYEKNESVLAIEYTDSDWEKTENRAYRKGDPTGIYTVSKCYRGEDETNIFYNVTKYYYVPKYDAYAEDRETLKEHPKCNDFGELEYTPEEWEEQAEFTLRPVQPEDVKSIENAETVIVYSADDVNFECPLYFSKITSASDPQGNYEFHRYTSYDQNDVVTFEGYEISRILLDSESGKYVIDDSFESIKITEDEFKNSTEWIPVLKEKYEELSWSGYFNYGKYSVMKDSDGKKYVVTYYNGIVYTFSDDDVITLGDNTYHYLTPTNTVSENDLTESTVTVAEDGLYSYMIEGNTFSYTGDGTHTHCWDKGVVTKKATPTSTGIKTYTCTVCGETKTEAVPKLKKLSNTVKVKAKAINAKSKKNTSVKKTKAFSISKAQGKITFKQVTKNKKIVVSKAGKVTVKKGLKKGKIYKIKVKVTAAGNAKYMTKTATVTLKIKIK